MTAAEVSLSRSSDDAADYRAGNQGAHSHPVLSVERVAVMVVVMVPGRRRRRRRGRRTMVALGRRSLMVGRAGTMASMGSGQRRADDSEAHERNDCGFEDLVHNAPSLSFFCRARNCGDKVLNGCLIEILPPCQIFFRALSKGAVKW